MKCVLSIWRNQSNCDILAPALEHVFIIIIIIIITFLLLLFLLLDQDQIQIGQGSYGLVQFAPYKPHGRDIREVVVKLPHNIGGQEKEFAKEVRLLNSVKGHPNIVAFEAVSLSPYALMTEYVSFSFLLVSSLADFLCHVDTHYYPINEYASSRCIPHA